jgi:hypothetical protein
MIDRLFNGYTCEYLVTLLVGFGLSLGFTYVGQRLGCIEHRG